MCDSSQSQIITINEPYVSLAVEQIDIYSKVATRTHNTDHQGGACALSCEIHGLRCSPSSAAYPHAAHDGASGVLSGLPHNSHGGP